MTAWRFSNSRLTFEGKLTIPEIGRLEAAIRGVIDELSGRRLVVDLSAVDRIDSAGVAFLDELFERTEEKSIDCRFENIQPSVRKAMKTFSSKSFVRAWKEKEIEKPSFFETIGNRLVLAYRDAHEFLYLAADSVYYATVGLFTRQGMRKGEYINQCILIGMNALPIIALISFLIGFILALQSAAQLRQFGAAIYVADLISISMTREMGPIMTAIVLAGRSGSAITSEIATMVVTEETDALKSMALNPIRYVLVPKIYAITTTTPLLTILSMLIGILGAFVIGVTYLGIGVEPFYDEVVSALVIKDIVTGMIKSIVFAWIIVIVGAYYGFRVKGGSEGVGRATTASVVASVFFVVLADCILGLIFYFNQPIVE